MKNPMEYLEQNLPTLPANLVWRISATEVHGEHFVYAELHKKDSKHPVDKRSIHVSPTVSRFSVWRITRMARRMLVDFNTSNSYRDLVGDYASSTD